MLHKPMLRYEYSSGRVSVRHRDSVIASFPDRFHVYRKLCRLYPRLKEREGSLPACRMSDGPSIRVVSEGDTISKAIGNYLCQSLLKRERSKVYDSFLIAQYRTDSVFIASHENVPDSLDLADLMEILCQPVDSLRFPYHKQMRRSRQDAYVKLKEEYSQKHKKEYLDSDEARCLSR